MFNSTAEPLHVSAHATGWGGPSDTIPSQCNNGHNLFSLQNDVYWLHLITFHWLIFSGPEDRILLLKQGLLSRSQLAPVADKLALALAALHWQVPANKIRSHTVFFSPNKRSTTTHCCPGAGRFRQRSFFPCSKT